MNATETLKKAQLGSAPPGITGFYQKRTLEIPATMVLFRKVGRRISRVFYDIKINSHNKNGVCIAMKQCPECDCETNGMIKPDCFFAPFSVNEEGSRELNFYIEIPNTNHAYTFRGKAVYTYQGTDCEYVGINFTWVSPETEEYLDRYFN